MRDNVTATREEGEEAKLLVGDRKFVKAGFVIFHIKLVVKETLGNEEEPRII